MHLSNAAACITDILYLLRNLCEAQKSQVQRPATHLLTEPNCTICPGAVGMGTPSSWRRASSADLTRSSFRLSCAAASDWLAAAPDETSAGETSSTCCCARLVLLPGSATGLVACSPAGEVGADPGLGSLTAANKFLPRPFASACAMEMKISGLPTDLIEAFGAGCGTEGLRAMYTFPATLCAQPLYHRHADYADPRAAAVFCHSKLIAVSQLTPAIKRRLDQCHLGHKRQSSAGSEVVFPWDTNFAGAASEHGGAWAYRKFLHQRRQG